MKVLLAVDGSPHAEQAVRSFRQCFLKIEVEILHVLDLEANLHPHLSAALIEEYHRKLRSALQAEADQFLPKFRAILSPDFQSVGVSVREGRAADVILQTATASGFNLIMLGSRGLSTIQALLLGGVCYQVAHEAPCPVLVVKHGMQARRKILLPVDRSEGAERAIRFLAEQSVLPRYPVVALTVCPSPLFVDLLPESVRRHGQAAALEYLDEVKDRLSARGYTVEPRVAEGDPAPAILSHAEAEEIDLIVMGSRGLHGLKKVVMGSVSQKVLAHATKSVLIVRGSLGQS